MFLTAAGGLLWVLHLLLKKKEEKVIQENTQNSIKHTTQLGNFQDHCQVVQSYSEPLSIPEPGNPSKSSTLKVLEQLSFLLEK